MKNSIFILVLGLIISGCSASFHVNKAKQKCPECFELDTTIQELVFKLDTIVKIDTNILVLLPKDTVFVDTTIKKLKPYSFKPIYSKNGIINVKVWMQKGTLHLRSHLDSAMIYHYKDEILIRDALITKLRTEKVNQTITIQEQEKELKWYQKVLKIGKYVIVGLLIFVVVIIIIKLIRWLRKK